MEIELLILASLGGACVIVGVYAGVIWFLSRKRCVICRKKVIHSFPFMQHATTSNSGNIAHFDCIDRLEQYYAEKMFSSDSSKDIQKYRQFGEEWIEGER